MSKVFDPEKERKFLNDLVKDYTDTHPYSEIKKEIIVNMMLARMRSKDATGLQLGCANGYETELLASHLRALQVVDGSSVFIERLKGQDHPSNITFQLALFEDLDRTNAGRTFDHVACNYVLEHVHDTVPVLKNIRSLMHEKSTLFITVPNSNALSRRLALKMGLLNSLEGLTENDLRHGHRRTYTLASLVDEVTGAGFEVMERAGVIFKILADFQLNRALKDGFLTKEHILGLQALALEPENISHCDSIFLVLRRK